MAQKQKQQEKQLFLKRRYLNDINIEVFLAQSAALLQASETNLFPNLYIPLSNRVRGPYCKLQRAFLPIDLWPNREARGPYLEGEKQGSLIYNLRTYKKGVSTILILSL